LIIVAEPEANFANGFVGFGLLKELQATPVKLVDRTQERHGFGISAKYPTNAVKAD
jgi:hypothetical protein